MITKQQAIERELSKGKSIVWWVMGYYIATGNYVSPSIKVPIFDFVEESKTNTKVLIDYLGSMMWINVRPERVFYGWGGNNAPSPEGKELRRRLEQIMCNNLG